MGLRSVAAYINSDRFGGGDSKCDPVDMDIASDLLWNTLIDDETKQLDNIQNQIDHMAGTSKLQYRDKVINSCLCPEVPDDESLPHSGRCPMNGKWESIKDSIYSFAQTAVTCVATPLTLICCAICNRNPNVST